MRRGTASFDSLLSSVIQNEAVVEDDYEDDEDEEDDEDADDIDEDD